VVFLAPQIALKWGAQTALAGLGAGAFSGAGKFGNEDAGGIAHNNHEGLALPVDEQANLPVHGSGQGGQFMGLLRSIPSFRGIAPGQQAGEGLHLAGFKPLRVSLKSGDMRFSCIAGGATFLTCARRLAGRILCRRTASGGMRSPGRVQAAGKEEAIMPS
jgi:hypothetical protein